MFLSFHICGSVFAYVDDITNFVNFSYLLLFYEVIIYVTDQIFCGVTNVTGYYSNRLLQVNAAVARELTCCKILVRHWAIREKKMVYKIPRGGGGKPYLASGLIYMYVKKVMKLVTFIFEHPSYISYVQSTLHIN